MTDEWSEWMWKTVYGAAAGTCHRVGAYASEKEWETACLLYVMGNATRKNEESIDAAQGKLRYLALELDAKQAVLLSASDDVRRMQDIRVAQHRAVAERQGRDFDYTGKDVVSWMVEPGEMRRMNELRSAAIAVRGFRHRVSAVQEILHKLQRKQAEFERIKIDYEIGRDAESITKHLSSANAIDFSKLVRNIVDDLDRTADRLRESEPDSDMEKELDDAFEELGKNEGVKSAMRSKLNTKDVVELIMETTKKTSSAPQRPLPAAAQTEHTGPPPVASQPLLA